MKMRKRFLNEKGLTPHLAIYAGVFAIFLATGVWGGRSLGLNGSLLSRPSRLSTDAAIVPEAAHTPTDAPANGQRNLLVIGVDQLKTDQPELESVWLVMFFPGKMNFTFLPVYPLPGERGSGASLDFQSSFSLNSAGRPDSAFLQQLEGWIWWNNYLVIDRTAMVTMINFLGGLSLDYKLQDGEQVMRWVQSPSQNSKAALASQVSLLEAICRQIHNPPASKEIANLLQKLGANLVTDLDLSESVNTWPDPIYPSLSVLCEFPLSTSSIP